MNTHLLAALALVIGSAALPARADGGAGRDGDFLVRPTLGLAAFYRATPGNAELPGSASTAVGLDLNFEVDRLFFGATAFGTLGETNVTDVAFIGGRLGYFLGEGRVTPYVSLAVGKAYVSTYTEEDEGTTYEASGLALLLEGGVTFFRRAGVGRVSLMAQLLLPTFQVHFYNATSLFTPAAMVGLKLAL